MRMARLGSVCTNSRGAEIAAQRIVLSRGVEDEDIAAFDGIGQRLERFGRRIDDEEMDAAGARAPA